MTVLVRASSEVIDLGLLKLNFKWKKTLIRRRLNAGKR
jgi:hypothetical protein